MIDFLQINKFSDLHDGKNIIFCKTDFLSKEFENISNLPNDVVLITGNSDYPIDHHKFNKRPKNIKKWYAQNSLVHDDILVPLPIGIENKLPSVRGGHGIGYLDRVTEKENLLSRELNVTPTKNIYANFNINTNPNYRNSVKEYLNNCQFIDWEQSNLSLQNFFDKILNYRMVLCPIGNGLDTHRLWEVLYSGRIPITIKVGDYKLYDLYNELPVIILDNLHELRNENYINYQYEKIIKKDWNKDILKTEWWKNKILYEN
jgi:hypothetical protein